MLIVGHSDSDAFTDLAVHNDTDIASPLSLVLRLNLSWIFGYHHRSP